jgi:putative ABC transport system ATP-binding protein
MSTLELDAVVKHYNVSGERVRAIDGVDLSVEQAEMVALSGPSGSGKSTLLLLTAGLLLPDAGLIRFGGTDLATLSVQARAEYLQRDIGFIFQSPRLMPKVKALDNAALKLMLGGLSMRESRARAIPWLHRLGLEDRLDHTPEQLSGGERQRVAIARALAGEPKLILADEPTGNLDSARSKEIVELLRALALEQGAAALLVTHDVDAAALAHRTLLLRDGRLEGEQPTSASSVPAAASLGRD